MNSNKQIPCPVCTCTDVRKTFRAFGAHGKKVLSKKKKFTYYTCLTCKSLFLHGIKFDEKYYKKYYGFEGYQQQKEGIVRIVEKYVEKRTFKKKLNYILHYKNKRKIRILDVGCGNGSFLSFLDPKKFDRVGLEINSEEYELAKKKGMEMLKEDILKIHKDIEKFDVITLWHVVEHISDPILLFTQLKKYLKPHGIIVLSTPNNASWGRKIGKEKWFHLDSPRHVILFDQKGIEYIAKKTNLTIKNSSSDTFEFPLDLFWSFPSPTRYFLMPAYLLLKYFSHETKTYVITQ